MQNRSLFPPLNRPLRPRRHQMSRWSSPTEHCAPAVHQQAPQAPSPTIFSPCISATSKVPARPPRTRPRPRTPLPSALQRGRDAAPGPDAPRAGFRSPSPDATSPLARMVSAALRARYTRASRLTVARICLGRARAFGNADGPLAPARAANSALRCNDGLAKTKLPGAFHQLFFWPKKNERKSAGKPGIGSQ